MMYAKPDRCRRTTMRTASLALLVFCSACSGVPRSEDVSFWQRSSIEGIRLLGKESMQQLRTRDDSIRQLFELHSTSSGESAASLMPSELDRLRTFFQDLNLFSYREQAR